MLRVPVLLALLLGPFDAPAQTPLQPFRPDPHTLLLYHFDEGQGRIAHDASGRGYHGEVRGAQWAPGRFGKSLRFDGKQSCVFRHMTEAITGLRQITVECWFNQQNPAGRQFLIGKDVTFHFDLSEGMWTSMSLYHKGGAEPNADGLPHQHLGTSVASYPLGGWHHNAVTYDGRRLSFFFDGVLRHRVDAARDFLLGVNSRGLWVGCYVGMDFWFSGRIDEVRVSDCVRYDPEGQLQPGQEAFAVPRPSPLRKEIRMARNHGAAKLGLTLRKLHGGNAAGRVYLKHPDRPAVIVGEYALRDVPEGKSVRAEYDVSDEISGGGTYVVGLEQTESAGYFAVTGASLSVQGKPVARWAGRASSRRTFQPPILVPLRVEPAPADRPGPRLLLPNRADRYGGELTVTEAEAGSPAVLQGNGFAEYWLVVPERRTYAVHLRYATPVVRPCDLVVDGRDLNDYNMCALNRTDSWQAADALWEYQGTTTLRPGVHWIRVQDVLPAIVAIRLEPAPPRRRKTAWKRYPVPDGAFLGRAGTWEVHPLFGKPGAARLTLAAKAGMPALRFSCTFANTDPGNLFAGDAVRFRHPCTVDLEPFGRLRFRYRGQGSGHVVALRAVDAKGDEKLLWRERDATAGTRSVSVPLSFEGNDVFDPGRVIALCIDVDEGNIRPEQRNRVAGALLDPVFDRRDALVDPPGYREAVAKGRRTMVRSQTGAPLPRSPGFRPWTRPVVPEQHPLFAATQPRPVTRATMGYDLHFTGARDISPGALDDFHRHYDFGDVCWPHIGICPLRRNYASDDAYREALKAFEAALREVHRRGLFLFDIWGYVPYEPSFPWTIAPEHHEILMRVFGDRFLGYDNGEQDGRYIGAYADRGKATHRREGWADFVAWDEHICADSMGYMNATGSLNFSHYYGERGARTLGLETAQGLPGDTLMFAFLRGASKQYGRLTTQATSVWNRFGYNMYHDRKTEGAAGYGFGPSKGCSLSLHRRLFFSSYLGGDSIVGTETAQFTADRLPSGAPELSPLGAQHLAICEWVRRHPDRGVMYTPIAFLMDFHSGWTVPRHLYRSDRYRVWGKFPYEKGDYLADALFRMVWPGYEDASYLRNERGFVTSTPYGDLFDVLTNRCHPDILRQYTAIMLLGDVEMTPELVTGLTAFVQDGGDLIVDARQARALPVELTGVRLGEAARGVLSYLPAARKTFVERPYTYTVAALAGAQPVLVSGNGHPLVTLNQSVKGRVLVGLVDYWMTDPLTYRAPEIVNMEPPYALLKGVRAVLDHYFASYLPVEVQPAGLNVRVCCYSEDPKRLLVGLMNNELFSDWRGMLRPRLGPAASAVELWRGKRLKAGRAVPLAIPAGDVAIVDLRLP